MAIAGVAWRVARWGNRVGEENGEVGVILLMGDGGTANRDERGDGVGVANGDADVGNGLR